MSLNFILIHLKMMLAKRNIMLMHYIKRPSCFNLGHIYKSFHALSSTIYMRLIKIKHGFHLASADQCNIFKLQVLIEMALFHFGLNQEWAFKIIAKDSCNQNSHQ